MNRWLSFFLLCIAMTLPASDRETFTLRNAIETGLENNKSLDYAREENRIGLKNLRMKYRKYFPTLNLGYSSTDTVTYFADDTHSKH